MPTHPLGRPVACAAMLHQQVSFPGCWAKAHHCLEIMWSKEPAKTVASPHSFLFRPILEDFEIVTGEKCKGSFTRLPLLGRLSLVTQRGRAHVLAYATLLNE